jgi:hypothetical protein
MACRQPFKSPARISALSLANLAKTHFIAIANKKPIADSLWQQIITQKQNFPNKGPHNSTTISSTAGMNCECFLGMKTIGNLFFKTL